MHISKPVPDVTLLGDAAEIPGLGYLPINAYVLHAAEPVLIDTGLPTSRTEFLDSLWSVVDPADLRWIYLTHPDRDHTGSLAEVLAAAPQARLVTTFLGFGIAGIDFPIPPDRVFLLNPGQSLDVGDRTLAAFRPPVFDSPATTGVYDARSGVCFSSDCFGSPLGSVSDTEVADIAELPVDAVTEGQRLWVTVDSPWVAQVDHTQFGAALAPLRAMNPEVVLSTHLPPARNAMPRLLDTLATTPDAPAFVGPDQAMLEAMLESMHAPSPG
ncbi:MAG TPA: MBL fold metallo-hydrolase [Mycobacteriales bacterium]|nr:MBL fold metallo-hydrolase [Mycobacteriales bacterium]